MADVDETTGEVPTSSWRTVVVPTEGLPGFMSAFYRSAPGKFLYYVTSDIVLFLRVSVVLAMVLGLMHAVLDAWAFLGIRASAVWSTITLDLLITLVAVALLHTLRIIVEGMFRREP